MGTAKVCFLEQQSAYKGTNIVTRSVPLRTPNKTSVLYTIQVQYARTFFCLFIKIFQIPSLSLKTKQMAEQKTSAACHCHYLLITYIYILTYRKTAMFSVSS